MDLPASTIRFILFIFNFLFLLAGLYLIVFGCLDVFSSDDASIVIHDHDFTIVGSFFIFIGLCICLVTFFGCWGAFYEKYSMIFTYGTMLSVLLILQLIFYGFVWYLCGKNSNGTFVANAMRTYFEKYYDKNIKYDSLNVQKVVDNIQFQFKCCGVEGPRSWKTSGMEIPPSCCSQEVTHCRVSNAYQNGCLVDVENLIAPKFKLSFIIWSVVFQVIVIGSTFYLGREIRTNRTDYDAI